MRLNSRIPLLCVTGALFIAIAFMGIIVDLNISPWFFRGGVFMGGNCLLAAPKLSQTSGVNTDDLEELNETKFMLTYEAVQEKSVQAVNSRHDVVLKGTNYTYPFVMGCNVLSGGFFTKEAQDQKSRVLVLNKWAAFEIFGSFDITGNEILINGSSYRIVGVIDDGDRDNKNLYTPIAHINKTPNAFMSVLNGNGGVTVAYVQNEYKQIGVTEEKYDFINLETLKLKIWEKALVSFELIIVAQSVLWLNRSIRQWVRGRKNKSKGTMLVSAGEIIISGGISVLISARCIEVFIRWGDSWNMLGNYGGDCFRSALLYMQDMELYSNIFFAAFGVALALTFISSWNFLESRRP